MTGRIMINDLPEWASFRDIAGPRLAATVLDEM